MIKRSNYSGVHSGQISLPGGKFDKNDSSLKDTALRECGEELGINIDLKKDLFALTPLYIPPSNFIVTPYLAYENFYPKFKQSKISCEKYLVCKYLLPGLSYSVYLRKCTLFILTNVSLFPIYWSLVSF